MLLRALIPSWKFFGETGHIPRLRFRYGPDQDHLGDWKEPQAPSAKRSLASLFLNGNENLWLAKLSLLDRLSVEFFEKSALNLGELQKEISYRLVENWVRMEISNQPSATFFQFEIRIEDTVNHSNIASLLSPIHEKK